MSAIVPFVGRAEKTARENLASFIKHAQNTRLFRGADALSWEYVTWDLRSRIAARGSMRSYVLHFINFESTGRGANRAGAVLLRQPFLDAARALVSEVFLTGRASAPYKWLMALRAIERAFRDLGMPPDICLLTPVVLDRAAAIIRSSHADRIGYGAALEQIARTINEKRLCSAHLAWRNSISVEHDRRRSIDVQGDGSSSITEKLPHLKCILDLASVFSGATAGADIVTTSWFALAMFAPSRVSEILTLPVGCETEMDGVYGLSWQPSKGGAAMTKYAAAKEWAEVANKAIARLLEWGTPARRAAAWYAKNPGKLYLPPGTEHLRGEPLSRPEVYAILGVDEGDCDDNTLSHVLTPSTHTTTDPTRTGGRRRRRLYEFSSLERFVLRQLPDGFPIADKKLGTLAEDALFCLPRHTMRANVAIHANVPELITGDQIDKDLNRLSSTIFVRHGLLDPRTGEPWKLTTHQPRHFLNTLAQSKYLSETLIAFWSGRKRVDQNACYNHIPHEAFIEAYVAMGKAAPREIGVVGPLSDKVEERARREMVSHDTALRLELGSIIATRYGLCRHNYALTPCPKDKNCIGCGENTFIKGDERQLAEARKQLEISMNAVANCRKAIADGEPGVERWLAKHAEAATRWGFAIMRMTDPSIPDGTLITLPPPDVSQTKAGLALAIRDAEAPPAEAPGAGGGKEPDMDEMLALGDGD